MKNFKFFQTIIAIIAIATTLVTGLATPTLAADKADKEPYDFVWFDSSNLCWHIQHYVYDSGFGGYKISDRVVLKNKTLYDRSGRIIKNNVKVKYSDKEYADDIGKQNDFKKQPSVGFSKDAELLFLHGTNKISKIRNSLDDTFVNGNIEADYLVPDNDGIIYAVIKTNQNYKTNVTNITFSNPTKRDTSSSDNGSSSSSTTSGFNLKMYSVADDPERMGIDATDDGKLIVQIYSKSMNVWDNIRKKLLSDNSYGSKFLAIDENFSVFIYRLDNTVIKYSRSNNYSKPEIVLQNTEIYYVQPKDNGALKYFVTNKGNKSF